MIETLLQQKGKRIKPIKTPEDLKEFLYNDTPIVLGLNFKGDEQKIFEMVKKGQSFERIYFKYNRKYATEKELKKLRRDYKTVTELFRVQELINAGAIDQLGNKKRFYESLLFGKKPDEFKKETSKKKAEAFLERIEVKTNADIKTQMSNMALDWYIERCEGFKEALISAGHRKADIEPKKARKLKTEHLPSLEEINNPIERV